MRPRRIGMLLAVVVSIQVALAGCTSTPEIGRSTGSVLPMTATTTGTGSSAPSTASTSGPHIRVEVAVQRDGTTVGGEDRERAMKAVQLQLASVAGATVTSSASGVVIEAPGNDTATVTSLLVQQPLRLRPVVRQWADPGTATVTKIPGSDGTYRNQPSSSAAAQQQWDAAVATYGSGKGPSCAAIDAAAGNDDPERELLSCQESEKTISLLDPVFIDGTRVSEVVAEQPKGMPGWGLLVTFDAAGQKTFATWTSANVGKGMAFVVGGAVISAPIVQQAITSGPVQLSGGFTEASAKALAAQIAFGALPFRLRVTSAKVVS